MNKTSNPSPVVEIEAGHFEGKPAVVLRKANGGSHILTGDTIVDYLREAYNGLPDEEQS